MNEQDYQIFFSEGMNCLEKKNYRKAQDLFSECYLEKKNFRTNYFLFEACYRQKDFKEACRLAQEYLVEYIKDNEKLKSLLVATVKSKNGIGAHKLYLNIKNYMTVNEKKFFLDIIVNEENKISKLDSENLAKKLKYCGLQETYLQKKILQESYGLPLKIFKQVARKILSDENVHQFIRISILDDLRELEDEQEINYLSIDNQITKLIPAKLHEFEQTSVYAALKHEILSRQNDDGNLLIWNEVKLKLRLLYPFEELIISDVRNWRKIFLLDNFEGTLPKDQVLAKSLEDIMVSWNIKKNMP